MHQQGTNQGKISYYPKMDTGRQYLINELKTKLKVSFKKAGDSKVLNFSAKGFSKVYDSFETTYGGL